MDNRTDAELLECFRTAFLECTQRGLVAGCYWTTGHIACDLFERFESEADDDAIYEEPSEEFLKDCIKKLHRRLGIASDYDVVIGAIDETLSDLERRKPQELSSTMRILLKSRE